MSEKEFRTPPVSPIAVVAEELVSLFSSIDFSIEETTEYPSMLDLLNDTAVVDIKFS
jgi:hypothetical protein